MPTLVYRYGLRPTAASDLEYVQAQLAAANEYRNALIAVELERRESYRAARTRLCPTLAAGEASERQLMGDLDAAKAKVERDSSLEKRLKADLQSVRKRLRELRAEAKENAELKALSTEIDSRAIEAGKKLRAECGVYWGTYLLIEADVFRSKTSGNEPKRKKYFGSGRLGVQTKGGITVPELFAEKSTLIRMTQPTCEKRFQHSPRAIRAHTYSTLKFRGGSFDGKPRWLEFGLSYSRPLPPDARIKQASIVLQKTGSHVRYELQLVVNLPESKPRVKGEGLVQIAFDWRFLDDGSLQVATATDCRGETTAIAQPARWIEHLRRAEGLERVGEKYFSEVRAWFAEELKKQPKKVDAVLRALSPWHDEVLDDVMSVRRSTFAKLATSVVERVGSDLVREYWEKWRVARLGAGLDLWADQETIAGQGPAARPLLRAAIVLDQWQRNDRHWYDWRRGIERRFVVRRLDHYRVVAARLSDKYGEIEIQKLDLRDTERGGRDVQKLAAPSVLRMALEQRFGACAKK